MRKKVTNQTIKIDDVANQAGVSPSTVSLYIRKPEKVSAKTGNKIQQAIDSLGYVYNKIASQFTGSKSKSISIIVPSISNEVIGDILQQIEEIVSEDGFQIKIASHDHNLEKEEEQIRSMLEWSPAILIVTGQEHTENTHKLLQTCSASVIQLLELGGNIKSQIGFDHVQSGFETAQYLLETGCKKIAYFTTRFEDDVRAQKRYQGYCDAIKSFNPDQTPILIDVPYTRNAYEDARKHLSQALVNHRGIDGIMATNDSTGIGVLMEAYSHKIAVPEHLSIIGFGDFAISSCLSPIPLSSVNLNSKKIAKEVARIALRHYYDDEFEGEICNTGYEIVPRDSIKLLY